MCFCRDQTRERMSVSRISGVLVWQFMCVSKDFELGMECVFPKKSTYCFVRALEVFGTEGMLGSIDDCIG